VIKIWYTYAYNKVSGIGGGILPPLPKTNMQIATPPEAEQLKQQAVEDSQVPPPAEKMTLQQKLQRTHTNGLFPVPATAMQGINPGSGIWDQYKTNLDNSEAKGQGYETQSM